MGGPGRQFVQDYKFYMEFAKDSNDLVEKYD